MYMKSAREETCRHFCGQMIPKPISAVAANTQELSTLCYLVKRVLVGVKGFLFCCIVEGSGGMGVLGL